MNALAARQVRMEIDESRQYCRRAEIDEGRTGGHGQGGSHRFDPLAADPHHGRLQWRAAATIDQPGGLDDDRLSAHRDGGRQHERTCQKDRNRLAESHGCFPVRCVIAVHRHAVATDGE